MLDLRRNDQAGFICVLDKKGTHYYMTVYDFYDNTDADNLDHIIERVQSLTGNDNNMFIILGDEGSTPVIYKQVLEYDMGMIPPTPWNMECMEERAIKDIDQLRSEEISTHPLLGWLYEGM